MNRLDIKRTQQLRRTNRVRKQVKHANSRPRLSVNISNLHVTAQIIDDASGKTLAYSTTVRAADAKGSMTEKAAWVGKDIAAKAKKIKVSQVAFDRGSKLYHGRVQALADAARTEGLEF